MPLPFDDRGIKIHYHWWTTGNFHFSARTCAFKRTDKRTETKRKHIHTHTQSSLDTSPYLTLGLTLAHLLGSSTSGPTFSSRSLAG